MNPLHSPRRVRLRRMLALIAALGLAGLATGSAALASDSAAGEDAHAQIQGSGSSWAANAVNQWIADTNQNGLHVVFTPNGSAQGRQDFANVTNDFAVTDIGFQGTDPATGASDTSQGRGYAYLPIVAGGTSFPYQIQVAGKLIKNLRLSGTTLAKIFTNTITNWNDPAITVDNNGVALPSLPIIPVVHSEGSGSTAQFTRYLDAQFPNIWRPFAQFSGGTEIFPRAGQQIAASGSDGVINYVTSNSANGAIGYDEYSYPLAKNQYPVAKIENAANYFTLPTQFNVAVALTQAQINTDTTSPNYLLQDLSQVYTYNDPRAYPLSSYSYGLIPTSATDRLMTTPKRQTIVDFLYYSVCDGQKEVGPIGYSPLPINLVQASFNQINQLKSADPNVDITNRNVTTCNNPTFVAGNPSANYLAQIAPKPPACDQAGMGPCTDAGNAGTAVVTNAAAAAAAGKSTGTATTTTGTKSGGTSGKAKSSATNGKSSSKGASGTSSAGSGAASAVTGGTTGANSTTTGGTASGTTPVDTGTTSTGASAVGGSDGTGADAAGGQVSADGTAVSSADGSSSASDAGTPVATTLAASPDNSSSIGFGVVAGLVLLLVVASPPLLARRLSKPAGPKK